MKNRTRLFLVVAVGVLVLGLGTGLVASYGGFQNFTIIGGNGPTDLAYVPADAKMVAFADVRDVSNSELRQKLRQFEPSTDAKNQFETETGIDIERDVDQIVAAAWAPATGAPPVPPLMLARGRFDEDRIETLIREHGGTVQDYKGKRLLVISSPRENVAVAFVEPGLVAAGDAGAVRRAIDTKQAGTGSITDNADVMKLIKDVDDGNAWAVGKLDVLPTGQLPTQFQLPPINWFAASGHIDSGFRAAIRLEVKDEKSAQDFREIIRGLMALARLQAGQRAEFAELVNSLELGGEGTTVSLGFSIPGSLIETLGKSAAQHRPTAPGGLVVPNERTPRPSSTVPSL
jgi:hypothetical protein